MPKRENRIKPIEHQINQIEMLKTLEPNATPEKWIRVSLELLNLCQTTLQEVADLESGLTPNETRLTGVQNRLKKLMGYLETTVWTK